jgi:hypothetical protein
MGIFLGTVVWEQILTVKKRLTTELLREAPWSAVAAAVIRP